MVFTSCSKDVEEVQSIVGTWENYKAYGYEGGYLKIIYAFNADGSCSTMYEQRYRNEGETEIYKNDSRFDSSYVIDGDQLIVTDEEGSVTVTFSISGDKLTLISKNEKGKEQILILTRKK